MIRLGLATWFDTSAVQHEKEYGPNLNRRETLRPSIAHEMMDHSAVVARRGAAAHLVAIGNTTMTMTTTLPPLSSWGT